MVDGKYTSLSPNDTKEKPSVYLGLRKIEHNDYIISKEREKVRNNTNQDFMKGCVFDYYYHFISHKIMTPNDSRNITSNNDCNTELEKELIKLRNELNFKREKLNYTLKSFPYGSLIDKGLARFDKVARWFCKRCGCLASMFILFIFPGIWWFHLIEMMLFFPLYAIIDNYCRIRPSQQQVEEWYQNNIASKADDFCTEKLDDLLVESLHKICSKLNEKYSGISLKPFTYVDTIEVESRDSREGGHHSHSTFYWDEFLVINENKLNNA